MKKILAFLITLSLIFSLPFSSVNVVASPKGQVTGMISKNCSTGKLILATGKTYRLKFTMQPNYVANKTLRKVQKKIGLIPR